MTKTLEQQIADIVSEQQRQTALLEAIDKRLAFAFPYANEPGGKNERDEKLRQYNERSKLRSQQFRAMVAAANRATEAAACQPTSDSLIESSASR